MSMHYRRNGQVLTLSHLALMIDVKTIRSDSDATPLWLLFGCS